LEESLGALNTIGLAADQIANMWSMKGVRIENETLEFSRALAEYQNSASNKRVVLVVEDFALGLPFDVISNCRHCNNVSFGDEPVCDSNPNSCNQTPDFSNPPPHHNYEIDSWSDTRTAFQAEFAKFQHNFERFMAQMRCSKCGGLFNGGNCPSCSIVGYGNEFVHDPNPLPYDNTPDFSYQPLQHHVDTYSWNEELNTIPEKELDEFIKSSVEDLILILSESEDTSGIDNFISSDDESLSDKDVPEDNVLEDIECKNSYDPNLDESAFLVTPFYDSNEDEYFTLGDDVELLLYHDPSIPKMIVASILEGFTDELPLEENDDLFDLESKNDDWKKILYDAPINDLITKDKVFDPGIHDQMIAPDLEASRARGFVHRPLDLLS
nr:hypothetical protein [Tanacetum cinerariifolium]